MLSSISLSLYLLLDYVSEKRITETERKLHEVGKLLGVYYLQATSESNNQTVAL